MNAFAPVIAGVLRVSSLVAVWSERVEMRRRLAAMPERLLADVGLDRAAVAREARRPFWRPFGACLEPDPTPRWRATSPSASASVPTALLAATRLPGATFPLLS
jgi:uncharacterized protein YjiS (DUF1127 family)